MLTRITHTKVHCGDITEVGAVESGVVVWRSTIREAVQRYRSGIRYYLELPEERGVEVVVDPGGLYDEPTLKSVSDRLFVRKLRLLPNFAS